MSMQELRTVYALVIMRFFQSIGSIGVIVTIMIIFMKHSAGLSSQQKKNISERLILVFARVNEMSLANEERLQMHWK